MSELEEYDVNVPEGIQCEFFTPIYINAVSVHTEKLDPALEFSQDRLKSVIAYRAELSGACSRLKSDSNEMITDG